MLDMVIGPVRCGSSARTRARARLPPCPAAQSGKHSPHTPPNRAGHGMFCLVAAVHSIALRSRVRRFESCWGRINRTKLQNARTSAHFADLHLRNQAADSAPHTPPTRLAVMTPPQVRGRRKQRVRCPAGPYPTPGIAAQPLPTGNCPQPPPAQPTTAPDEPQAQPGLLAATDATGKPGGLTRPASRHGNPRSRAWLSRHAARAKSPTPEPDMRQIGFVNLIWPRCAPLIWPRQGVARVW